MRWSEIKPEHDGRLVRLTSRKDGSVLEGRVVYMDHETWFLGDEETGNESRLDGAYWKVEFLN